MSVLRIPPQQPNPTTSHPPHPYDQSDRKLGLKPVAPKKPGEMKRPSPVGPKLWFQDDYMEEKEKPVGLDEDEDDFEGSKSMVYCGPFFPRMKDKSKKSDNQLFFAGRLKALLNQVILAEKSLPKKETKASAMQKKLDLVRADLMSARADLKSLEGQFEVVEGNFDQAMSILRGTLDTGQRVHA